MMGGGAVLSVAAVVMLVPASRHHLLGTLRGEALQNGKYVSQWVDDLSNQDEDTRREAANNLGNLGTRGRSALPELLRVTCEDPDEHVRCMAAFAVYKIASAVKRYQDDRATEILDALIVALQDDDPIVRMNATLGLGTLGPDARKAVPQLEAGIKRKDNDVRVLWFTMSVREQMILTLGFIGPDAKGALRLLEESLADKQESTRCMAATALGKLGTDAKHAVPLLLKTADNPSEHRVVRQSARDAIALIDPESAAKKPASSPAVQKLSGGAPSGRAEQ